MEHSRGRKLTGNEVIEILQNMYDNKQQYKRQQKAIHNIDHNDIDHKNIEDKKEQEWQRGYDKNNRGYDKNNNKKRQRNEEKQECSRKDCNRRIAGKNTQHSVTKTKIAGRTSATNFTEIDSACSSRWAKPDGHTSTTTNT